jgi:hypothetical protein
MTWTHVTGLGGGKAVLWGESRLFPAVQLYMNAKSGHGRTGTFRDFGIPLFESTRQAA